MTNDEHKVAVDDMKKAVQFICSASPEELEKFYGKRATPAEIYANLSNEEIISKYRDYKASIAEPFQAGDEVRRKTDLTGSDLRVVTAVSQDEKGAEWLTFMTKRGRFYSSPSEAFTKTGKYHPQVNELIDALNGKGRATPKEAPESFSPVALGMYRHFKGKIYEVIANGWMEDTGIAVVVYKDTETGNVWVRDMTDFNMLMQQRTPGGLITTVPRFTRIGDRR